MLRMRRKSRWQKEFVCPLQQRGSHTDAADPQGIKAAADGAAFAAPCTMFR
ncbi:hypothetical protein Acsp04_03730 [Actinomadura sp. NBRC 104425]|nr:hypothetical protein Acsp04_03730 [Actinomadura sp. NBRC 104425]